MDPVDAVCSLPQAKCQLLSLKCYFLELVMVMDEEEVDGDNIYGNCLHNFNEALLPEVDAVSQVDPPLVRYLRTANPRSVVVSCLRIHYVTVFFIF